MCGYSEGGGQSPGFTHVEGRPEERLVQQTGEKPVALGAQTWLESGSCALGDSEPSHMHTQWTAQGRGSEWGECVIFTEKPHAFVERSQK